MGTFQDFLELLSTRQFIILIMCVIFAHISFLIIKEYLNYRTLKKQQETIEMSLRQSEESIRNIYDEIEEKRQRLLDQIEQNPQINISHDDDRDEDLDNHDLKT